jgi:hypothetical protein
MQDFTDLSDLSDTIVSCQVNAQILDLIAPNATWRDNLLMVKWANWKTRNMLTDAEYRRLEIFLNRCVERAIALKQQAAYEEEKNSH